MRVFAALLLLTVVLFTLVGCNIQENNTDQDEITYIIPAESSLGVDETLAKADEILAKADETLAKADETHIKADETLVKADETLVKADETHVKADEIYTEYVRIIVDGEAFQAITKIVNGEMLLPLQDMTILLGGSIDLDSEARQANIAVGDNQIALSIDGAFASANGIAFQLDIPVRTIDDITYAPLQLFSDYLNVGFGRSDSAIYISATPATSIPVLLYHHLLPDEKNITQQENALVVSTESFDKQMKYLHDNGFYTLTISDMEEFLYNGKCLPERSVMIHFDDGYYSNFVYGYPILKQYGHRAIVFFITHYIEDYGENQPPIDQGGSVFTAAKSIKGAEDVFETASHSHDMHKLVEGTKNTVLSQETKENIISDTLRSFDFVSNHTAYAYPRTQYNTNVIEALTDAGIKIAFIGGDTYVTADSNPFELNRIPLFRYISLEGFESIVNCVSMDD